MHPRGLRDCDGSQAMKVSSKVGSFTYSAIHEMTRLALEHDEELVALARW